MVRSKKSGGAGRPNRLTIYVPENILKASATDREVGRFNDKVNNVLQVLYANGGRTDSMQILKAEYEAEAARYQALAASMGAQAEAAIEAHHQEVRLKKAEDEFRDHVKQALARGAEWKHWLHPDRSDVKNIGGIQRAKQIMKEFGVEIK